MSKKPFTKAPGTRAADAAARKPVTTDPGKRNPETSAEDRLKSPVLAATPKPPSTPTTVPPKGPPPLAAPAQKPVIAEGVTKPSQVPTPEAPRSPTAASSPKQSIASAAMARLRPTAAAASPKIFTQPPSPKPPEKAVTVEKPSMSTAPKAVNAAFVLNAPEARQVSICGDFNDWEPRATPMKRQEGGRWGTTLALRPGRYQYKFVADGQWIHDPNARENVPNEHGSLNSVIEIRV